MHSNPITRTFLLVLMALALTACASAPKTPKQTMAATYVTIETLAESTLLAFQGGQIDRDTTTKIYNELKQAKAYVDLAVKVESGTIEAPEGVSQLEQARDILLSVEAILKGATNE